MVRSFRHRPLMGIAALFALTIASSSASAQSLVPFRASFTGTLEIIGQEMSLIEAIAEAEGMDNSFNLTRYDARVFLDSSSNPALTTGMNAFVSDDGNALFGTFLQESLFSSDPATIPSTFTGTQTFAGGGGIFENATGMATFDGTFLQISPTMAQFTINFVGSVTAVPEPGVTALLGTALLGGAGIALRRRRSRTI